MIYVVTITVERRDPLGKPVQGMNRLGWTHDHAGGDNPRFMAADMAGALEAAHMMAQDDVKRFEAGAP